MLFQIVSPAYAAASAFTGECVSDGVATITGIECLMRNLLAPAPGLIALAAVGMIIYSGVRIITAGSDAKALASAWQSFTFALIGLALLALAWFAIVLVEKFTGAPVTQFGIPTL